MFKTPPPETGNTKLNYINNNVIGGMYNGFIKHYFDFVVDLLNKELTYKSPQKNLRGFSLL